VRLLFLALTLFALPVLAQYTPNGSNQIGANYGFQPLGKTAAVSTSGTSAKIALSMIVNQVQVYNSSTASAFIIFCATSTCTASVGSSGTSTSDYPVAPGSIIVMTVPAGTTYVAVILASSTGITYFTPGVGL
jgi:hypothetical protein